MIWAPSGGIGSAYRNQTGMFSPENQAKMKEAAAAQYKSYTENQARIQAEGLAKMEREREALRSYRPAAGAARYYDPDSTNYVNPYYIGPNPNPGVYSRFHWESPGSGIQYSPGSSFAGTFNDYVSSRFFDETDVSGLSPHILRSASMEGGFGYLPYSQALEKGLISDEVQANLAYNKLLRGHQYGYKTFFDKEALDYFKAGGIDVAGIKTTEDLEAIPTALKGRLVGDMLDIRARRAQAKNQRPKPFGFGDALGIGLTAASMFVPNPWVAGTLAASGSAAGGGDLGDIALAGGLAGLGNWAGDKFGTWAANTFPNATAATGIGSLGTAAGWGGLGLEVAGQLIQPTISAIGHDLFAESPPTPQGDSSSDSQGGILSGVTDRIAQGVGSLPQTTSSFVDPTPYLGRVALDPAFMNQFERAELGLA
jgi:hypothetical protein